MSSQPRRDVIIVGDRAYHGMQAGGTVCRDSGVLFVADEVIRGFGRLGTRW